MKLVTKVPKTYPPEILSTELNATPRLMAPTKIVGNDHMGIPQAIKLLKNLVLPSLSIFAKAAQKQQKQQEESDEEDDEEQDEPSAKAAPAEQESDEDSRQTCHKGSSVANEISNQYQTNRSCEVGAPRPRD